MSATRLARSVDNFDIALTLMALESLFLVHSSARSSSGWIAQNNLDSIIVNCRASSIGSKSRMLHCVRPSLLALRALSWLLVIFVEGALFSLDENIVFEMPVLPIEETSLGTRAPARTSVTFEVNSARRLPAAGRDARSFPVAKARIKPKATGSLSADQWLSSQPLNTL